MATITLRSVKGSPLTNAEVDANFSNINTELGTKLSATGGTLTGGITVPSVTLSGSGGQPGVATLTWNDTAGTLDLGLKGGNVTMQIGEELFLRVTNSTGSAIPKGSVVYITGSTGSHVNVVLSQANSEGTSSKTLGITAETIANAQTGFVATNGIVSGLDTSTLTEGGAVWLSATVAGGLTSTRPSPPDHAVLIGWCVKSHASVGALYIHIANGYEVAELHDVLLTSIANNQVLSYESASGLWKNRSLATVANTGAFSDILSKPTTLSGYGITDAPTVTGTGASGTWGISITGNAATATTWETGRTIALTGDVTGTSGTFNGSANLSFATTLANSGVTAGTYTKVTVDAKGRVTGGTNPTNLSGYGITDALSSSATSTQSGYFGDIFLYDDSTPSHYLQITNSANLTLGRVLNLNVNDADRTISLSGNLTVSAAATVSGTNTGDQTITLTGDVTGSGTGSFATTLANSGVAAGTYGGNNSIPSITFDAKGRATAASTVTPSGTWGISITGTSRGVGTTDPLIGTGGLWVTSATGLNVARNGTAYVALDAGNYSSYALPLTGGTLTGALSAPNFRDGAGAFNVNLGSGGSEGRGLVAGYSGGAYGGIGFNVRHTATSEEHIAPSPDTTSYLRFQGGGFFFFGSGTGAAGRTVTYTGNGNARLDVSGNWYTAGQMYATTSQHLVLNTGNYNSYAPTLTGTGASGSWGISVTGNAATATLLGSYDLRTISPSAQTASRIGTGFTSWANNNTSPYADYIHLRSYSDSSGGNDNLVMFRKDAIGMRIWQQSFGSATAYSSYVDVITSGNYNSYSPTLTGGNASGTWGINISGSAAQLGGVAAANYFRTDGTYPNADMNSPVEGYWHVASNATGLPEGYYGHRWDYDHLNNGQWIAQFYSPTSGDPGLWFRQRRDYSWQTWRKFLDSTNYGSYALPLTGGIMTGPLTYRLETSGSGEAWHRQIHWGRYDARYTAGAFPNYLPGDAFGLHVTNASDAAFFGLISRGAGSNDYNAVIAWGDDSDDVLQFRFNNGVVAQMQPSGALRVPSLTAGGSTNTDATLGIQGTSHLTGTIYFGGTVGNVNSWSSLMSSSGGNEVHSVNTFTVNRSGYGGGNILEATTSGYVLGGGKFLADAWVHSERDFPSGTLIQTDINYAVSSGDPFILEIRGNSYGSAIPFDIQYQGYIYYDTIINHGGYSNGTNISGLVAINYNGNLCFWFPSQSYWHGYYVRVYAPYATYPRNRVTSISGTGKPTSAKEVGLSANIRQSLHSGNYNDYTLMHRGNVDNIDFNTYGNYNSNVVSGYIEGSPNKPTAYAYNYGTTISFYSYPGQAQFYVSHAGNDLCFRGGWAAGSWQTWNRVLTNQNYNSYSPTLTGSGASGTWGINITGNAGSVGSRSPGGSAGNLAFYDGSNGYLYTPTWIGIGSGSGLFSSNGVAGAHFYPSNATYGAWRIDGSNNGWGGIAFGNGSAGIVNLMTASDSNSTGFHNQSYGWQFQWANGVFYIAKNAYGGNMATALDSSNYNSYSPTLTGGNASGSWNITAARATRANGNFYIDDNYGCGIVGAYASTRYQGVFAMGDSYKLPADGTSAGNLYGIAWSYPSAGGVAGNLDSHGMLVLINGGFGSCMSYSIVAAGNVTAYSDERLKTNWRPMPENFVERLAQVKVGIYDRIDGEQITQVGIGAQSFQKLLPEAITKAKDEMGTLSVSYGNAAMASAVELAKEIVAIKRELEALKAKLH